MTPLITTYYFQLDDRIVHYFQIVEEFKIIILLVNDKWEVFTFRPTLISPLFDCDIKAGCCSYLIF